MGESFLSIIYLCIRITSIASQVAVTVNAILHFEYKRINLCDYSSAFPKFDDLSYNISTIPSSRTNGLWPTWNYNRLDLLKSCTNKWLPNFSNWKWKLPVFRSSSGNTMSQF